MEHDQESEVAHVLGGWRLVVRLPEMSGRPVGICRYRDKILITTEYGYVFSWDEDRQVMEKISALPLI